MTISTTTRKAGPYAGNGVVSPFFFAFKVFSTSDIVVTTVTNSVEWVFTEGVHYAVALNSDQNAAPGGYVALFSPLPIGTSMVITSDVPALQGVAVTNNGGFFPDVFNTVFDRLTILVQQLAERVGRTLSVPTTSGITNLSIPVRPNAVLQWNSTGTALGLNDITQTNLPTQTGNGGKYLTTDGTTAYWATQSTLPAQAGQVGKYLTTDGANTSWTNAINAFASVPGGPAESLSARNSAAAASGQGAGLTLYPASTGLGSYIGATSENAGNTNQRLDFVTLLANVRTRWLSLLSDGVLDLIGGRIKFPATALSSADPNTMDDFERGYFTPVLTAGGVAPTGVAYGAGRFGQYQKEGTKVTFQCRVPLSSMGAAGVGQALITGMPFPAVVTQGVHIAQGENLGLGAGIPIATISGSTLNLRFQLSNTTGPMDYPAHITNTTDLLIHGEYFTS